MKPVKWNHWEFLERQGKAMNLKYLVTASIVGGVVLFLWGFITHSLLPQPMG
jgi:hypothetical protein